jgi:phospholipase C
VSDGSSHLVALIDAVISGPQGLDTLIIVVYDEFGGQWDHVPPPPHGRSDPSQHAHDQWGPGTRIPALLVSKRFTRSGVDHTDNYDTTSILKLLEDKFHLHPLTARDKAVRSLREAVEAAN